MSTRNVVGVACAGLFMLVSSAMAAPTVTITQGPYQFGSGGEFSALVGGGGSPGLPDGYSFQTFCVEKNELLSFGDTYDYTVSGFANSGGLGGGPLDPLDPRTAWLYNEFTKGNSGALAPFYDFGNGTGQRANHAGQLQNAFWYLEEELNSLSAGSEALMYVQMAEASPWYLSGETGDIQILNLWDQGEVGSGYRQDVLAKVPPVVPVPGAFLMASLGTIGAGYLRRRRMIA